MLTGLVTTPDLRFGWWSAASLVFILVSLALSFARFRKEIPEPRNFTSGNFGFDRLVKVVIERPLLASVTSAQWFDKNVIDGILHQIVYLKVTAALVTAWVDRELVDGGTTLVSKSMLAGGSFFRSLVSGKIQGYLLWAMAWLVIFITWLLL